MKTKVFLKYSVRGCRCFNVGFDSDGFFFQMREKYFPLRKNSKCIYQGNVFVSHVTGSTYSGIVFSEMYISWIYTKL